MSVPSENVKAVAATIQPDFAAIKTKQQATWSSGDYAVIGSRLQIVGEHLAEAADVRANERVLDVAAGNGNATLAAARRFARVTSTDYVDTLLQKGAVRAAADGLDVAFEVADAEALPYENDSFDVVLSTFGVMFTPEPSKAASEMKRVVRSGGRIGLANWTPDGFIGQLFKVIGKHVPPPAGIESPARWGTEARITQLFEDQASQIRCEPRIYNFRYASPAHWLDIFRRYYGPTHKAFGTLDTDGQANLARDITQLLETMNIGGDGSLVVPSEYLEIVITKR
ncbi:MAG: class I SAM-dependent methyltransferase [Ectothiorhodospiraceae bacterium]|nr:class I SAM-dependent methyltransferase [Ectothiorhodospiraceae bacterium]